jgi:alpha-tubulin suppressor-like RCC1 family protein
MRTRSPLRHAPLALAAAALVASACAERITDSGVTPAGPNAPRMSVIPSTPYVAIEGGQSHACGLDGSGQLHCWGRNPLGQLGDSTATNSSVPVTVYQLGVTFAAFSAGPQHNCAVTLAGQAYCWGANADSRLGDSTTTLPLRPIPVLPLGAVAFTDVHEGNAHSCGLNSSGQAYCWGANNWGQIGDSTTTSPFFPVAVHQAPGVTFTQVVPGNNFTCALASGGQAWCWGYAALGALGNNSVSTKRYPVTVSQPLGVTFTGVFTEYDHVCAVDTGGQAYCWGSNAWSQLGDNTTTTRKVPTAVLQPGGVAFTQMALGSTFTCALDTGGQTYCWGNNSNGQLGNGTTTSSASPVAVTQPAGVTFTSIKAEIAGMCGLDTNGQTWCWGLNTYGQLGDGSTTQRTTPVAVSH